MSLNDYTDMTKMGLRDDIEDAPGKEPVRVEMTEQDRRNIRKVLIKANELVMIAEVMEADPRISAPVEAALHDFAIGLDELIKETLGKVRDDD